MKFAIESLYRETETVTASDNKVEKTVEVVKDNGNSFSIFDWIGDFFGGFFNNLDIWLININYFFLAWSIFYTVILLIDFWYYKVRLTGMYEYYEIGEKSLKDAKKLWFGYFWWLVALTVYAILPGIWAMLFGILMLIGALAKFIILDLMNVSIFSNMYDWTKEKTTSSSTSWFGRIFGYIFISIAGVFIGIKDISLGIISSIISIFTGKESYSMDSESSEKK